MRIKHTPVAMPPRQLKLPGVETKLAYLLRREEAERNGSNSDEVSHTDYDKLGTSDLDTTHRKD